MNPRAIPVNKSENNDFGYKHEKALFLSCRTTDNSRIALEWCVVLFMVVVFGKLINICDS
jgi:hypothetical protein